MERYGRDFLAVIAKDVHFGIAIFLWHYSSFKLLIIIFLHETLVEERFPTNRAVDLHPCVLFIAVLVHIMITFHEVDGLPARVEII